MFHAVHNKIKYRLRLIYSFSCTCIFLSDTLLGFCYQSQSTVFGATSLLFPSLSSSSPQVPSRAAAREGTHHEIFWHRQVVRHHARPRRDQSRSRRQPAPL